MADRADHRGARGGDRADERFVAERQQVLDTAAAARDDDHLDGRIGVQAAQRLSYLDRGGRALHGDVLDPEPGPGQPPVHIFDHVALGRAGPSGDETDGGRQERQRLLRGREHAFGREQALESLERGEELAEADEPDLAGAQAQ